MSKPSKKRMRLDKNDARIIIVGGGLAGFSAALALERAGFQQVSLYERDDSFERQKEGYGLTLTYNPKGPLASLGILEQVAQQDCPSRSHYLFQSDGTILGYFGNAFSKRRGIGQRGNLRVPRKVLRRILINQLKTTTIHWGYRLVDYAFDAENSTYGIEFTKSETFDCSSADCANKTVAADLLIAADGIRSAILSKIYRLEADKSPNENLREVESETSEETALETMVSGQSVLNDIGLRHMGVRLILGIAEFNHPLLDERGFYTLDGKRRLFTMPYFSSRYAETARPNRIMWQLSFATSNEEKISLDSVALRNCVIETCRGWHEPILAMIKATPLETIWGTDLLDRDPVQVQRMFQRQGIRRLVIVGDALHSMSPFKGQGANQALADGPLLASWLQKSSIDAAVTGFWRETVQRTGPVVQASRIAARELHSPSILQHHGFAGVLDERLAQFLDVLRDKKIGANLGADLDAKVREMIEERNVGAPEPDLTIDLGQQRKALEYASNGDTQSLRQQSLAKHSESIRTAKDEEEHSCLHLAAIGGHLSTCKWLLTEMDCDPAAKDSFGMSPWDYAPHPELTKILKQFWGQKNP